MSDDMTTTTEAGLGYAWQQLALQAREIYEPVCHLCHEPIDLALPARHRRSWTLDHLDARATHGNGIPSLSRVRPAHRSCNSSRGKRALQRRSWAL